MNRPDEFDPMLNSEDSTPETEPTEAAPVTGEWHSISYRNGNEIRETVLVPRPRRRGKKIAMIAALVALAVLLCATAGFGGALLADYLYHFDDSDLEEVPEENKGGIVQNGGTTPSTAGQPYPNTDVGYDFAAALAELTKNTDESLIGSANGSAGNAKKSLIEVTAAVKDSVVEIATTTVSNRGQISAGAGSGVIIHEDGLIVTNNHVIEDCDEIIVRLTNGDTYYASLRGTDAEGDIAILKITPQAGKPLTVARLGYSKALALGEEVIAIGNPLGELGGTVTNGIISALERQIVVDDTTMTLLQTNAAINSGNSGGGLFNMAGELVGIVNAKYAASGVEGLGFAIPIDTAFEDSFKDLLTHGYIRGIPSLGITMLEHTGGNFLNVYYGAYVYDVGEREDFKVGDYIYSIDGTVVYGINTSALSAIRQIVRSHEVGDTLTVVVKRSGTEVTLTVTLQEYIPEGAAFNIS